MWGVNPLRRAFVVVTTVLCCLASSSVIGSPDLSDGTSVLILLAEPYGANTMLWLHQFERLGWNVTLTGLDDTVRNCSTLCRPVAVDVALDRLEGVAPYDAVVVSTTPGTFSYMPVPAADLRNSDVALALLREADATDLTLYTSCAGLLVLGEAGVLEGRTVVCHPRIDEDPLLLEADCRMGGQSQLPIIDGNLVTSTSGRFFAQEIPEAIARSLDRAAPTSGAVQAMHAADLPLQHTLLALPSPAASSWSLGTEGAEGILGLCPMEDGFVAVGYTFSGPGGSADLLVIRCDREGHVVWARAIGGPGRDYAQGVCPTEDGGIVVVGYTTSAGEGCEDVCLLALGVDGNVEWVRTFGGAGPDMGFGIVAMEDGGFAVCGNTAAGVDVSPDLLVMRTDASGGETWRTTIPRPGIERGHGITCGANGDLYVTGGTTSGSGGNYDVLVVSLSPNGEILWQSDYGFPWFDVGHELVVSPSGDIFVTGYGDQEGADINNVLIVRYAPTGERLWAKRIGEGREFEYGDAILQMSDGSILVCGAETSGSATNLDLLFLCVSQDGELLWEASLGNENASQWATAMCQISPGRIVVAGHTRSGDSGSHDALLLMLEVAAQADP